MHILAPLPENKLATYRRSNAFSGGNSALIRIDDYDSNYSKKIRVQDIRNAEDDLTDETKNGGLRPIAV